MSEFSWSWTCNTGDGTPVTQGILASTFSLTSNLKPSDSGVIYWNESNPAALQELGISNPVDGLLSASESGGVVSVETGAAIVTGWLYVSDETTDFDINGNPGAANATDIIALRRDTAAGTVRIVRLNGLAGSIATLTQTSLIWEIPLWEIQLNAGGGYSGIADRRIPNSPFYSETFTQDVTGGIFSTSFPDLSIWTRVELSIEITNLADGLQSVIARLNGDSTPGSYSGTRWNTDTFNQLTQVNTTQAELRNNGDTTEVAPFDYQIDMSFSNHKGESNSGVIGCNWSMSAHGSGASAKNYYGAFNYLSGSILSSISIGVLTPAGGADSKMRVTLKAYR